MLKKTIMAAALLLTASSVGVTGLDLAQAASLPAAPQSDQTLAGTNEGFQLAKYTKKHRKWHRQGHRNWHRDRHHNWHRWHGHRHWVYSHRYGHRYHYRHGPYVYYYGGWWYPRPWWLLVPGIYLSF